MNRLCAEIEVRLGIERLSAYSKACITASNTLKQGRSYRRLSVPEKVPMGYLETETVDCGSSLRANPVTQTLERARRLGPALGITRVTDITRLDRIGIPVFASIRPGAQPGSLCVNAGKGLTPDDACASAWMEAIEYAWAEPGASTVKVLSGVAQDVLGGNQNPNAIYDFCPLIRAQIAPDTPMPCVVAEEMIAGELCLVPAELVFLPDHPAAPRSYFGSSSIGLASGNTLLEATIHGIAEAIEHDICSFHLLYDSSALVSPDTWPAIGRELAHRITSAGLSLYVRFLPNDFGLPCFHAAIVDGDAETPMLINGGYGCHPHRQIALTRAICEAVQSRLSVIHGGRDDLAEASAQIDGWSDSKRIETALQLSCRLSDTRNTVRYEEIADSSVHAPDLPAAYEMLVQALARNGMQHICRIRFTPTEAELQVVKVLIPRLEACAPDCPRVGRRLLAYYKDRAIQFSRNDT